MSLTPLNRDRAAGIGALGLSGVAGYLFLAVAGRSLGPVAFASLGALWAAVFLLTAALAAPLEIAVAREVGAARGRDEPPARAIAAGATLAVTVALAAVALALIVQGPLDSTLFSGQSGATLAGGVACAGLTVGAAAKGACAGVGRIAGWGGYSLVDGGTRLGLSLVAAALAPDPAWFVIALAAGPWVALLVPAVALRGGLEGARAARAAVRRLAAVIGPLVLGAAASATLTYLGAVLLPALVAGPDARVGAWIAALALARLPLFAFSPFVAIAVPPIACALEAGEMPQARRAAGALAGIAAGGSLLALAAFVIFGDSLVALFGAGFALPGDSLRSLGLASACWLLATAFASIAIGAGRGRLAAAGWCGGLLVAAVVAIGYAVDPFVRTDAAVALGALGAVVATGIAAAVALMSPRSVRPAPAGARG